MSAEPEPDSSLRIRLVYVAGETEQFKHDVKHAYGDRLDDIAWRFGLKRRGSDEVQP